MGEVTRVLRAAALIAGLGFAADAAAAPVIMEESVRSIWGGYGFDKPKDWHCSLVSRSSARAICTRVGINTHLFEANRIYREDADNFIGLDLRQPVSASVLAEAFIARRLADDKSLTLAESREVALGGQQGFRAEFTHTHSNGLKFRTVAYGVATVDGLHLFTYRAPELTFFAADLPAIEAALATLKLTKPMRP